MSSLKTSLSCVVILVIVWPSDLVGLSAQDPILRRSQPGTTLQVLADITLREKALRGTAHKSHLRARHVAASPHAMQRSQPSFLLQFIGALGRRGNMWQPLFEIACVMGIGLTRYRPQHHVSRRHVGSTRYAPYNKRSSSLLVRQLSVRATRMTGDEGLHDPFRYRSGLS